MLKERVWWNEGGRNKGDEIRGRGPKRKTLALVVVINSSQKGRWLVESIEM
jgi:hypothetical protein